MANKLFLAVIYSKHNIHQIIENASVIITDDNYDMIESQYVEYKCRGETTSKFLSHNNLNINELNDKLKAIISKYKIEDVYLYGDNQIYHKLLCLLSLNTIDTRNMKYMDLTENFNPAAARKISKQSRIKEYPNNRGQLSSVINLCGLIAKNLVYYYSPTSMKLYPGYKLHRISSKPVVEVNHINMNRVKIYDYMRYRTPMTINEAEIYLQSVLLSMFYPEKFQYNQPLDVYLIGENGDVVNDIEMVEILHQEIINLSNKIPAMLSVDHSEYGGIRIPALETYDI